MKCNNCKKELVDGSIYCVHCGEKLSTIDNVDSEYNYNVDNQKVYDEFGNKINKYRTNLKKNMPEYHETLKTIIMKNKVATIIGSIAIVAAILGIGIFNYMKGTPVNQKELQSYLIDQNVMVDGNSYKIENGQLKSLDITSRKSVKKKNDKIQGVVTLDLDKATVIANVNLELYYNEKDNKWKFNGLKGFDIKNIEPKVDLNDSIKDLLKNSTINYKYNNIDLRKGLLKDIGKIDFSDTGINRDGTAVLVLSNGVVGSTVSAKFVAHFDLKEGKWVLNSNNLQSEIIQKEKIEQNLSDDDKKKFALTAFENNRSYRYKYKSGEYDYSNNINLSKDNISDLKINNFMEYSEDSIRIEIEGQATSGDISNIKFSGVVYLDLSLSQNNNYKTDVNIDLIELSNINLDSIKKDMLKYKIDDKQITVAIADTFKLGNENKDSKMFNKIHEGTITINGAVENIKTWISMEYNDKNKKYEWKLNNVDVIKK